MIVKGMATGHLSFPKKEIRFSHVMLQPMAERAPVSYEGAAGRIWEYKSRRHKGFLIVFIVCDWLPTRSPAH